MTDRIKGLSVSLTHDIRDDDCECIINAIKMIKGVSNVKPHISNINDWMARQHIKEELRDKIIGLWKEL